MIRKLTVILAITFMALAYGGAKAQDAVDSEARASATQAQADASQAEQGVSAVSGGLVVLEERVTALETNGAPPPAPPVPVSLVEVDCDATPTETIGAALLLATPGTPLTVSFSGTCEENVFIEIDDITLAGLDPTDHSLSILQGEVTVTGVQRVVIEAATIKDSDARGVHLRRGAAATLRNLTITNNANGGVLVRRGSFALLENLMITNNLGHGVFVNRGSTVEIVDTSIMNNARTGLQANRGSNFDVRKSNIAGSGERDVNVIGGSRGRIEDSDIGPRDANSTEDEDIQVTSSNLQLRDVAVIGDVRVGFGHLQLRDTAVTGDVTLMGHASLEGNAGNHATSTTITGNVQLSRDSLLTHGGTRLNPFTVTGNVTCSTSQSGLGTVAGDSNPGDPSGLNNGEGLDILGTVTNCTLMERLIGPQS